jgi:hypothetical protein
MALQGGKYLKEQRRQAIQKDLCHLAGSWCNVQDITLKLSIFVQLIVIASWVQEL